MGDTTNDIEILTADAITELKDRVSRLAQKLNRYVQKNGCSPELKAKARRYFGEEPKETVA